MNRFNLALVAAAVVLLAGCETAPRSSATNCAPGDAGCAPQAVVAAQAKAEAAAAQQAQNEAESRARFDVLQAALNEELRDAELSIAAVVDASKTLPKAHRARNSSVLTKTAPITDSKSPRVAEMTMLDTVSVEVPLAGKGKRGYVNAMNEVKALATRVADRRGGATILVEQNSADVRGRKVNAAEGESQTTAGNPLTVQKVPGSAVPRGVERYTIQTGELSLRP